MKERNKQKALIIVIIIAVLSIILYKSTLAPKFYEKHMDAGIKYLTNRDYQDAIISFDKAIKIESKSTEARIYQSQAYLENNQVKESVDVLEEAQNIDITNKKLIMEILDILYKIDGDIAYEFLNRFIESVGVDNISIDIKDIFNSAYEIPESISVNPVPGKYISAISITLKPSKMTVGHSYYYTLDGSTPTRNSMKYKGKIDISQSTIINLVGYNKNNESTGIINLEYIIDENIVYELEGKITEGENLINSTIVGEEIGNILKGDKYKLQFVVDKAKELLKKDSLDYKSVSDMKYELENLIDEFKDNIIKPTDKSKLKMAIDKAQTLYNNSQEGVGEGEYKSGSRELLLNNIDEAKIVYDNKIAKQKEIDDKVYSLQKSINSFEKSKIIKKEFSEAIALQYFRDKYGPPPAGWVYVSKGISSEGGLKYCWIVSGPINAGGESYKVYENKVIEFMSSHDDYM